MFVHDFVYIDLPAGAVRAHILADHGSWLSPLASRATAEGDAMRVRIGPSARIKPLGKITAVEVGQPFDRGGTTVVPMAWNASSVSSAFPVLHADLEIAPLGSDRSQLSLLGRYEPPLGGFGRRLDQVLLHRIAEASVRSFLHRLADALSETVEPVP